jgi:hypothetical protein
MNIENDDDDDDDDHDDDDDDDGDDEATTKMMMMLNRRIVWTKSFNLEFSCTCIYTTYIHTYIHTFTCVYVCFGHMSRYLNECCVPIHPYIHACIHINQVSEP